ncbi:MAG: mevalonate kinase [Gammaproteobacteria bacterium]|nr:mevalonate kinase [Gammaproteobacteria bacterium]
MSFYASAPATLMLMGEHAVLHKKLALVAAIDQRISLSLTPRSDNLIVIHSALGHLSMAIDELAVTKPFQFVLAAVLSLKAALPSGCDILIKSEFSDRVGLGSSAAVTVATVNALRQWLSLSLEPQDLIIHARKVVRDVQGIGSGADVAASVLGGCIVYGTEPLHFEKLVFNPMLTAVYSGSKLATREVIDIVEAKRLLNPIAFTEYFTEIERLVLVAKQAINEQNWPIVADCFKANQKLMQQCGVSNALLESLINGLEQQSGILAAKISGSGLGDCVIGLGHLEQDIFPRNAAEVAIGVKQIPLQISEQGVQYGLT